MPHQLPTLHPWVFAGAGKKVALDDFRLSDESPAQVDRESISAIWAKKYPQFRLIDKDLDQLVPSEPITEENAEKFDDFSIKFLSLATKRIAVQLWLEEERACPMSNESCSNREDWYKSTGESLVKKVFTHYDVNGDGVLDKEESTILYSHFADEFAKGFPDQGNDDERIQNLVDGVLHLSLDEAKATWQKRLEQKKEFVKQIEDSLQAYSVNKEEKDKAAFAIMDVNGDGELQLQEVIDSFRPNSDLRKEVLTTLGLHGSILKLGPSSGTTGSYQ